MTTRPSAPLYARLLWSLSLVMGLWASQAHAEAPNVSAPLTTVPRLDIARYLGTWYEIAKFPNRFQRMCAANTQAEYRALESGQIEVINRCQKASGEMAEAVGKARLVGEAGSPKLQVRFAPAWLSFLPMVWGNYWVIDLDDNYQLAAVSEPQREYLWILSRTPKVEPAVYAALLKRLQTQGFDTQRLEFSPQN